MKDENRAVAIEEFVGLKPKMYSLYCRRCIRCILCSRRCIVRCIVATISNNEHEDVLLHKKCTRHLVKKIQSKNHTIEIYDINKNSLCCFDDKIYIQNNGSDGMDLAY